MYKFYITKTKTFDNPGPNQPKGAITTYYKPMPKEAEALLGYAASIINVMKQDLECEPFTANLYNTSIKKHTKKGGAHYTVAEVIIDLFDQLNQGKDVTESMINRWNAGFIQIGHEAGIIEVVRGMRPAITEAPKISNDLFITEENDND